MWERVEMRSKPETGACQVDIGGGEAAAIILVTTQGPPFVLHLSTSKEEKDERCRGTFCKLWSFSDLQSPHVICAAITANL